MHRIFLAHESIKILSNHPAPPSLVSLSTSNRGILHRQDWPAKRHARFSQPSPAPARGAGDECGSYALKIRL
ncbi:uncharacterized protein BDZ99DRAFT_456742 [Mytilinidion resinicola]|uniref:Uncharacterized protein n=1 Tax=Mytilinidion resinicola TaxID=574789 RepID=A0A6A6Z764_9PEZI|nr:uncharacterized protein BDZ99DRAFT_456742 [Mytilinidion resinicola]KAF2816942.1 hypothetical protein BDZ99DRAFT_456742 [Mytilinidion resinicola]